MRCISRVFGSRIDRHQCRHARASEMPMGLAANGGDALIWPGKPGGEICIAPVPRLGRIPLFFPLELKVIRPASQVVKRSLGVVAIGSGLFLPELELAKY